MDVSDPKCDDAQCHPWEDVGVVALPRVECLALVDHRVKWAPTGKHTATLTEQDHSKNNIHQ
ncbi:hypothetical protein DPMN_050870 [Dreissena polymorpha]|uniref:Uncharacterized protein n=1 Tax=Dreissena polymorpha TaxID=45954 RepID=A0A9D4CI15_DREPO|nr:hypothetical protein DPMN_050870 [Dreissena polymorpha]